MYKELVEVIVFGDIIVLISPGRNLRSCAVLCYSAAVQCYCVPCECYNFCRAYPVAGKNTKKKVTRETSSLIRMPILN